MYKKSNKDSSPKAGRSSDKSSFSFLSRIGQIANRHNDQLDSCESPVAKQTEKDGGTGSLTPSLQRKRGSHFVQSTKNTQIPDASDLKTPKLASKRNSFSLSLYPTLPNQRINSRAPSRNLSTISSASVKEIKKQSNPKASTTSGPFVIKQKKKASKNMLRLAKIAPTQKLIKSLYK